MQGYIAALQDWAIATSIRAIKTFGQAAVILIGSDMVNVVDLDWTYILGASLTMAIASIATSLGGLPEVNDGSSVAAIVKEAKN